MLGLILLIVLLILLIGAFPRWGYNEGWGYFPFGGLLIVLIVIVILWIMGII